MDELCLDAVAAQIGFHSVFCVTRKHIYMFLYLYLFHQLNDLYLYLYSNWVRLKPDSG